MKDKKVISGIQQIGVGVSNLHEAWDWYRKIFKMDIEIFDEEAVAELMTPHTNNKAIPRHAVLALNLQGGGGFEIWQQTKYKALDSTFDIQLGDLGIYACKMKCRDVDAFYARCQENQVETLGGVSKDPRGVKILFIRDPYKNLFQIVESNEWFKDEGELMGGVYGAIIGVSDVERSLEVYQQILDHNAVLYDEDGLHENFLSLPGSQRKSRRVLLKNDHPRKGAFGKLLGSSEIELVQLQEEKGRSIFENRIWGDLGYIHLCFDTHGMDLLKAECKNSDYPFSVDSADSFDMGVAAGRFSYISDPDGALIEFVETHKVPIVKKMGWYMNLEKRDPEKHLPNWMINTFSWKRKK